MAGGLHRGPAECLGRRVRQRDVDDHHLEHRIRGRRDSLKVIGRAGDRDAASRAPQPRTLPDPRGRHRQHWRIHRQLAQHRAPTLSPRLNSPYRVRIVFSSSDSCGIAMLSTEMGEDQNVHDQCHCPALVARRALARHSARSKRLAQYRSGPRTPCQRRVMATGGACHRGVAAVRATQLHRRGFLASDVCRISANGRGTGQRPVPDLLRRRRQVPVPAFFLARLRRVPGPAVEARSAWRVATPHPQLDQLALACRRVGHDRRDRS